MQQIPKTKNKKIIGQYTYLPSISENINSMNTPIDLPYHRL